MESALYAEMFAVEQRHWWFAAKHEIVLDLLRRYLPKTEASGSRLQAPGFRRSGFRRDFLKPGAWSLKPEACSLKPKIADLGCGCGGMLARLSKSYEAMGMDSSPEAAAFAAQRGIPVQLGFLPDQVPLPRGHFDAVLMLDVLEHLDDDYSSVAAAAELLRDQGILICTVPAYQWLWTKRDEHHHHRRRYSWDQFHRLFDRLGLRIEVFSHFNTWLFPLALAERLSRRLLKRDEPTDLRVPPAAINRLFQGIFASERRILGRFTLPFGLSLVAVVRKDASGMRR